MKKSKLISAILFTVFVASIATAQNDNKQAMIKAAQENMKPGKMHQVLYRMIGTWNGKVKLWYQDGFPPLEFTTESNYETINNGLHLTGKTTGNIMGMPFTGYEHFGYNNPTKKFYVTWIDNMGSGMQFLEGDYDATTQSLTYAGNTTDPMVNPVKITRVLKFISDSTTLYEMFSEQNNKKSKVMEIQFSKVKKLKVLTRDYTIDDLDFLNGKWKVENMETYENWNIIEDKSLRGSSYKIKENKEIVSEKLSITAIGEKIVYTATVLNQNNGLPVDFTLNKNISNKFSFENLNHDFPKKIQYTKLDERTLFVEVLGESDRGFSFKMIKQ